MLRLRVYIQRSESRWLAKLTRVREKTVKSMAVRSSIVGKRSWAAGASDRRVEGSAPTFSTLESDCLLRPAPSRAEQSRKAERRGQEGRAPPSLLAVTRTHRVPSSTHFNPQLPASFKQTNRQTNRQTKTYDKNSILKNDNIDDNNSLVMRMICG